MIFVISLVAFLINTRGEGERLRLDGDEGHYLNMTRAVAQSGSLQPEVVYDLADQQAILPPRLVLPLSNLPIKDGHHALVHRPGLGLVLAPGYLVAGVTGAFIALAMLAAALSGATFLLARRVVGTASKLPEWWSTLLLSSTVPLILFSFHLYPEVVAGLLVALAAWALLSGRAGVVALAGIPAGLLPWFSLRYLPLTLGIWGAALLFQHRRFLQVLSVSGLVLISMVGIETALGGTLYDAIRSSEHYFSWRFLLGPGLLGSLFDQQWGLLPANPMYVAALGGFLGGLLEAGRYRPRGRGWLPDHGGFVLLAVIAIPYLLSILLFNQWHGGISPPARFLTPVLPLASVGLAYGLARFRGFLWQLIVLAGTVTALGVATAYVVHPDLRLPTGDFANRHRIAIAIRDWTIPLLPNLKNPNHSHVVGGIDTAVAWSWLAILLLIVGSIILLERRAGPRSDQAFSALSHVRGPAWAFVLVLVFLMGYAVVTWPWILRLWGQAPSGGDEGMFVWGFAWMRRALETTTWPFTTERVFSPVGAPLAFHTWMPLWAFLSVPIQWIAGPVLAYNLMVVLSVVLAGLASYALAKDLSLGVVPAMFAGLMFAFAPPLTIKFGLLGHQNLALVFWIPLALLLTRRLLRQPTLAAGGLLGLALAGALLSDLTVAVYSGGAVGAYLAGWALVRRPQQWTPLLVSLVAAIMLGLVTTSPLLIAMTRALMNNEIGDTPGLAGSPIYSNDLAGFFVAPAYHPVLGPLENPLRSQLGGSPEGPGYVGFTIALLAVVGFVTNRRWRVARWLGLLAAASLILSLGPALIVLGRRFAPLAVHLANDPTAVSPLMPYTWIQAIPVLTQLRVPARMLLLAALPLALLGALGVEWLLSRFHSWSPGVAVLLAGLVLFEGYSPVLARMEAQLPPTYQRIAESPDPSAVVVDVPLGFRTGFTGIGIHTYTGQALVFASQHEKPVAVGFVSRLSADRLARVAEIPLYRDLIKLQAVAPGEPIPETLPAQGEASAREHHFEFVVVRTDVPQDVPGVDLVREYLIAACFRRIASDPAYELYRFEC